MEAATLPAEEQDGAPVGGGAEATRSTRHLFQYSVFIHAGAGAEDCEHREDGKCRDEGHFHAWLTLPNSLQHGDIQEKARAAKARRQLAMRDPQSDAYAMVEADLDALMHGDREIVLKSLASQQANKRLPDIVAQTRAMEEFEDYGQHREEWQRLSAMPEDERPQEEWEQAQKIVMRFAEEIETRLKSAEESEMASLANLDENAVRDMLRAARIEQESEEVSRRTYYTWLGFVGTRKVGNRNVRVYDSLADWKNAPPEAVEKIDEALEELEMRLARSDAQGN